MTDVLGAVKKLDQEPWKMFTKKLSGKSSLVISNLWVMRCLEKEELEMCYMKFSITCRYLHIYPPKKKRTNIESDQASWKTDFSTYEKQFNKI